MLLCARYLIVSFLLFLFLRHLTFHTLILFHMFSRVLLTSCISSSNEMLSCIFIDNQVFSFTHIKSKTTKKTEPRLLPPPPSPSSVPQITKDHVRKRCMCRDFSFLSIFFRVLVGIVLPIFAYASYIHNIINLLDQLIFWRFWFRSAVCCILLLLLLLLLFALLFSQLKFWCVCLFSFLLLLPIEAEVLTNTNPFFVSIFFFRSSFSGHIWCFLQSLSIFHSLSVWFSLIPANYCYFTDCFAFLFNNEKLFNFFLTLLPKFTKVFQSFTQDNQRRFADSIRSLCAFYTCAFHRFILNQCAKGCVEFE